MLRRRHHARGRSGPHRQREWQGFNLGGFFNDVSTFHGDNASLVDVNWARFPSEVLSPVTSNIIPSDWTVLRTILTGNLQYQTNSNNTSYVLSGGVGLIAWEWIDDSTPAQSVVPWPTINPEADWFARYVSIDANSAVINSQVRQLFVGQSGSPLDFKSKRKLSAYMGILVITTLTILYQNSNAVPINGFGFGADARLLMLES